MSAGLVMARAGLALLLLPGTGLGEQGEHARAVTATLVDEMPVLDGTLDEAIWARAARADGFIQTEPTQGEPARWPTEVYVAYTPDALLVGARLRDEDPDGIVAREYRRDANLDADDNFMVVLDTYHDHRNAFFFTTNAVGTRQDGLIQNEGAAVNNEWDGVWRVGSTRTTDGWSTEIMIPFETLRFPRGTSGFGVNFGRQVARTREQSFWAEIDTDWGFNAMWRISAYGLLDGLEHAEPGGRVKLKPFGVGGVTAEGDDADRSTDLGLDAKVALGSNLNLDLTVNTDFAQVEADEQQVNLTRFELFFPEKREFFLENAGLFQVGEVTRPFEPPETLLFFSRRIGLSDDGDPLPILGGARLTGKLGGTQIGAFHIRQEELPGIAAATGFSAVRVRQDVLERSTIGVLALDRTEIDGASHRVGSVDFSWAPTGGSTVNGFWARSSTPGAEGRETAWGFHAEATNDRFFFAGNYTDIGEGFDSQMGYVPRRGIRKTKLNAMWTPRPGRFGIRQIFFGPNLMWITEPDGTVQTGVMNVGPFFLFNDGSQMFIDIGRSVEGLSHSFELREGVVIEAGEYHANAVLGMLNSSESRRVSVNVFAMSTGFFDGTLRMASPGVSVRPHPRVRLGVNYQRNQIRLPQPGGDFNTNLFIVRGLVALSADAFVRGLLQWNDDDETFSGNVQLRWHYAPGSDFYLVYNDRRPYGGVLGGPGDPARRELVAKLTWYWVPG